MPNELNEHINLSALILAAGNSTRMGSPKFMLKFNEGKTFLENIIEGYINFGCKEITVVVNPKGALILEEYKNKMINDQKIIINSFPEKERFFSIQTGLKAIKKKDHVFIHPVDNPFIDFAVLQMLVNNRLYGDYQCPFFQDHGGHPILISGKVLDAIIKSLEIETNFKIFLKNFVQYRVIVNNPDVLYNINTNSDYSLFQKTLSSRKW
jgi:molybdenum cofactor cytidylyltransferase